MSDNAEIEALKAVMPYPDIPIRLDSICARPEIHPTAWVAPGAVVNGRVVLKARSGVWYNCVLRGDIEVIEIGEESNVQDGSTLHTDAGVPCILGKRVTVGHNACVHGATVHDGALIAIGATVLNRCVIGEGALIAAGALVLEGTVVPPRTLWVGAPAKQVRVLSAEQSAKWAENCLRYVNNAAVYMARYGRAHIDQIMRNAEGILRDAH